MALYALIDAAGAVLGISEWDGVTPWEPPAGMTARVATSADLASRIPAPLTDDQQVPPPRQQLLPAPAVGKPVLRDLAFDAAREWAAMDSLNTKVQADGTSNAAQKAGTAALAQAAYARARNLAGRWQQAT